MSLAELRARLPLGQNKRVFVIDNAGRFLGIGDLAEAHATDLDQKLDTLTAVSLVHGGPEFIAPETNIRMALRRFLDVKSEILTVTSREGRVLGSLSEAYALRRYNEALERQRAADHGDSGLFGSPAGR
jgi:CIC family chloride channel protein